MGKTKRKVTSDEERTSRKTTDIKVSKKKRFDNMRHMFKGVSIDQLEDEIFLDIDEDD